MEKDKLRLSCLDGLRGFAIILVFLNHINTSFVQTLLPSWLFGWIWTNGVTGVTFLFILSGFLMSTIYPNPTSGLAFLQKRYTRIFPLFLTMCAVMFMGGLTHTTSPLFLLEILFCSALVTYFLWVFIVKKLPKLFGRLLFFLFLAVQIFAASLYLFWINKLTFADFSSLPTIVHNGSIFLVNATLTLPLGQYIPMLDGVYWTLVAEVLFYILYPILVVPLAKFLAHKSFKTKIVFLLSLIPLLGGIHILSYKIFVLSLIQPALFFYFATGVFLGYLFRNHTLHFEKFSQKIFPGKLAYMPFILFFLCLALVNDLSFLGQSISPWIRMLFAIPLTFLVAILLDRKTLLSKFFSLQVLTYIGTVSYSIYLSHSLMIHIAGLITLPNNLLSDIVYIVLVFVGTVGIASLLFFLLERPYFQRKKDTNPSDMQEKSKQLTQQAKRLPPLAIFLCIILLYGIGIFAAYQSQNSLNFFSFGLAPSQNDITISGKHIQPGRVKLQQKDVLEITIPATYNNLSIINIKMHHNALHGSTLPQGLVFTLSQKGSTERIVNVSYGLDEFNKGLLFPFGFPTITQSKDNIYVARIFFTNPESLDYITFDSTSIKIIYQADKASFVKNPLKLMTFIQGKLVSILQNQEALLVLGLLLPFVGLSIFLFCRPSKT